MPTQSSSDSMAALAAAAIAGDPKLQSRVRLMVKDIINYVEFTMNFGKSDDKAALMKAVVPAMMRQMATVEDDQTKQAQQESYDRMREALGGEA